MRILWVKVGGLWPLTSGGRLRSFHLISELAARHQMTVLTSHGEPDDHEALRRALPSCTIVSVPHQVSKQGTREFAGAVARSWLSPLPADLWRWCVPALRAEATRRLVSSATDLCVADFLYAIPNVPTPGAVPIVLFEHNVEYMIWKRLRDTAPSTWRRTLLEVEWRKMRRYEARACVRTAGVITVSELDRRLLAAAAPGARLTSIPTGVDTIYFAPNGTAEHPGRLVFTGSMDWYPNEDAILYFVDAILPDIRREVPHVSLEVVGRNPSDRLQAAASSVGVHVTGIVEDVRPHVRAAEVYIVPLRVGGGTRLKIFEAMAMRKAVVSTTVGAEGLPLRPGQHFLQADKPAEFAQAVVALLRDRARREDLAQAGRRLVEERFSWSQVAREFESACREVTTRTHRRGHAPVPREDTIRDAS